MKANSATFTQKGRCRLAKLFLAAALFLSLPLAGAEDIWLPHIDPKPADAKAIDSVWRLKKFLVDTYGHKIISGQEDLTWRDSIDMAERVYRDTGKYPALMGFDFMNYTVPGKAGDGKHQTEEAIAWAEKGGIVAFMWHWREPTGRGAYPDFYSEKAKIQIPYNSKTKKLEPGKELDAINRHLDIIAAELLKLQEKEIPVLWRPLHEAAGTWFWWGNSGGDAYIALYKHLFDYLTKTKGVHNLLWVSNAQDMDWYPGDEYVDIIGWDVYEHNYNSHLTQFNQCYYACKDPDNNGKLVALTENGSIPDPDELQEDLVWWLYFMTWNDTDKPGASNDNFWEGNVHNSMEHKIKVYNSDYVLTLDELPDLKNYPLK